MKNIKTFSKKFIFSISIFYFLALIWAIVCITFNIGNPEYIEVVLNPISLVMTSGVVGYLLKSAQENKEKIINNYTESEEYNDEC